MEVATASIQQLTERYGEGPCPEEVMAALRDDPRRGARELARRIEARRAANRAEGQRLRNLLRFEQELWAQGYLHVAGTDEAGMAPLAGPVTAAAVILPRDFRPAGINDSKQVDAEERARLAAEIKGAALAWGVGFALVEEIDSINIYHAGLLAMRRAVLAMAMRPSYLLVDARKVKDLDIPQRGIIKGDALSLTIAAASIIAKTTRDGLMAELDQQHPGYGFAQHKGYPTPDHIEALEMLGACPIHRRSFAPVRKVLGLEPVQGELALRPPSLGEAPAR